MIYGTPSKTNLAFPTDIKIGLITFSQKLLLNSCFQQLENTKSSLTFHQQKTRNTHTVHTPTITARIIEVISFHPLALAITSETLRLICVIHLSDLSCLLHFMAMETTYLAPYKQQGVSNVWSVNDVMSVSTKTCDESVPRRATVPSLIRGKEGGQSHIINLVAECVPRLLGRDWSKSFKSYSIKALQRQVSRRSNCDWREVEFGW